MISTLAFVDPEAKLGNNVTVYPFAFIDKNNKNTKNTFFCKK